MAKPQSFKKNDPRINRNGAPKKEWTWGGLLADEADKADPDDDKLTIKESVSKAILEKARAGDIQAFKEIANRTDGMPRETKDINITLPEPIMEVENNEVLKNNSNKKDNILAEED